MHNLLLPRQRGRVRNIVVDRAQSPVRLLLLPQPLHILLLYLLFVHLFLYPQQVLLRLFLLSLYLLLELFGIRRRAKSGRWKRGDDLLYPFAVCAPPENLSRLILFLFVVVVVNVIIIIINNNPSILLRI